MNIEINMSSIKRSKEFTVEKIDKSMWLSHNYQPTTALLC